MILDYFLHFFKPSREIRLICEWPKNINKYDPINISMYDAKTGKYLSSFKAHVFSRVQIENIEKNRKSLEEKIYST